MSFARCLGKLAPPWTESVRLAKEDDKKENIALLDYSRTQRMLSSSFISEFRYFLAMSDYEGPSNIFDL